MDPIRMAVKVNRSIEVVWKAWTDAEHLQSWLVEAANVRPEPGGEYELFWDRERPEHDSTLGCILLEVQPGEKLRFTWKGPTMFGWIMNVDPLPTRVSITLQEEVPGRTLLLLEHEGWGEGPAWQEARGWHEAVWRHALGELQRVLEREESG